jgi:hypothetical protein
MAKNVLIRNLTEEAKKTGLNASELENYFLFTMKKSELLEQLINFKK